MKSKEQLRQVFENGDKPKQEDFWEWQDSYWHKDEKIPKENVDGIPLNIATVDLQTENGTITGNVNTKEQVDEKIASAINELKSNVPETYDTLKEIADWINNDETAEAAILQTIQNETTIRANADNLKLDIPTIISNSASYPYLVGENGNGASARLSAGDFGKNFFNADLANTTIRNHTMNAALTVNTLGNPHSLAGLPNKNTDIANFRKVRVQNTSGLDAVVDSKNILIDIPSQLTDVEKTTWKTAMNGGWTTNTMSVAFISPVVVKKVNRPVWIVLRGANLNLPPTSFSIEIMDSTGTDVIATIPNSNVNFINSSELNFWFNFNDFPESSYKIRLWNGVAYYVTGVTFNVASITNSIDFSDNIWNVVTYNNIANDISSTSSTSIVYKTNAAVFPYTTTIGNSTKVFSALSKVFATTEDNFYIEFDTQTSILYPSTDFSWMGITLATVNSLNNDILFGSVAWKNNSGQSLNDINRKTMGLDYAYTTDGSWSKTIIIKRNNFITVIMNVVSGGVSKSSIGTYSFNNTNQEIRLKMLANANGVNSNGDYRIIDAYKF